MIIEPIKDKKGNIINNVELTKIYYEKLKSIRDGVGAKNQDQKEQMELDFYNICGGRENSKEIMDFMKQIAEEPDPERAQRMLAKGLIPIEFKTK